MVFKMWAIGQEGIDLNYVIYMAQSFLQLSIKQKESSIRTWFDFCCNCDRMRFVLKPEAVGCCQDEPGRNQSADAIATTTRSLKWERTKC